MLAAPISEIFGRHIVYLISLPLGALFTLGAGFSANIWTLCITRFLAGLAYSPALAIGAGSIADLVGTCLLLSLLVVNAVVVDFAKGRGSRFGSLCLESISGSSSRVRLLYISTLRYAS